MMTLHQKPMSPEEQSERFRQLYIREYAGMLRYAATVFWVYAQVSQDSRQPEETVQETFALAWQKREEVFACDEPTGWLFGILKNKIREQLRENIAWTKKLQKYQEAFPLRDEEGDLSLPEVEDLATPDEMALLRRVYVEGYSYLEVCQERGLSKSNLGVKLHRIKRKIQSKLDEVEKIL